MKLKAALLGAAGVLVAGSASAAPVVVDNFTIDSDNGFTAVPGFIPAASQVGSTSETTILGGFRDVEVSGNASAFVGTRGQATGGHFNFSNNANVVGNVLLTWDGDDSATVLDATGLGGVDLTSGGRKHALQLDVLSADLAGLEMTLRVFSDAQNASEQTVVLNSAVNATMQQQFLYSAFVPTLGGGADFTDVGAVQLELTGPADLDVEVDNLQTVSAPVPVPAALPLMAGSLLGLAAIKYRRRR